jgi:putative FmdB family regulatory protein
MPIYEYICEKCGEHLEVMQKVSDAPLRKCRKCRGKLEKVISRTSFQLKGSGWYKTDYSAKKTSSENAESKKPEKESPAKSTPSTNAD